MRITGGELRGRRFRSPGGAVRPSSDRVREATFARLVGLEGRRVLDLYAGSGALGFEALSRGAARAVFVERAARPAAVLRANIESLGLADRTRVVAGDARRALGRLASEGERFDLAFLDPPYASDELAGALGTLVSAGLLAPGATVVVERGRRHPVPTVPGLVLLDERRYGDTVITRFAVEVATGRELPGDGPEALRAR